MSVHSKLRHKYNCIYLALEAAGSQRSGLESANAKGSCFVLLLLHLHRAFLALDLPPRLYTLQAACFAHRRNTAHIHYRASRHSIMLRLGPHIFGLPTPAREVGYLHLPTVPTQMEKRTLHSNWELVSRIVIRTYA